MAERSNKESARFLAQTPGGIVHPKEVWRSFVAMAGFLVSSCVPRRRSDAFFDWLSARWQRRHARRFDSDPIAVLIRRLLAGEYAEDEIPGIVADYHAWRIEDLWSRWQASRFTNWNITTEVEGLEHIAAAHDAGRGVVLWGSNCCGTLFPKIALSNAGVAITQLSTADHGTRFPLTLWGKWIAGPLHCRPENRFIARRVRIPVDGNTRYLFELGKVLKEKGTVWIAAERSRPKKHAVGTVLNRRALFPIGAPVIARRNDAVLLPVGTRRLGRLHYRVVIEPPILLEEGMNRAEAVAFAVERFAEQLDRQVLEKPGDWEWNHLWVRDLLADDRDSDQET